MKKLLCFVLAVALLAGTLCTGAMAAEYKNDRYHSSNHKDSIYTDIGEGLQSAKYLAEVFAAAGSGASGCNVPECDGMLTRAEAISIASRIHSFYFMDSVNFPTTKPWYKAYMDYAVDYGIVAGGMTQLNSAVTRGEFASMLYRAFPREPMPVLSYVLPGSIPDVDVGDPAADAVYYYSKAGVFSDFDEEGNFHPEESVPRDSVYGIISKILIPALRSGVSLKGYVGSTAPLRPAGGDEFFDNACIIGNSLVEGLGYYSNLNNLTYYSTTGMTVMSALSRRDFLSRRGIYESAVDAAAAGGFSKVYLELGINEIGLEPERFVGFYEEIIDRLQASLDDADIYILSLTPVNIKRDSGGIFTMARVNAYNEALKILAIEKGCYYIDCVTTMVDETGFLSNRDTWDGVHFYEEKYSQWEDIIRTHYVD